MSDELEDLKSSALAVLFGSKALSPADTSKTVIDTWRIKRLGDALRKFYAAKPDVENIGVMMLTFEELRKINPTTSRLPANITTPFWENLYQLFKERMIAESKDQTP